MPIHRQLLQEHGERSGGRGLPSARRCLPGGARDRQCAAHHSNPVARPDRLPPTLPEALRDLQYKHDDFGQVYATQGLEYVMRLAKHRDEYQEFLMRMGERLVNVAEQHEMPALPVCPPLKTVTNSFAVAPALASGPPQVWPRRQRRRTRHGELRTGIRQFVFIAGQRGELQAIRRSVA